MLSVEVHSGAGAPLTGERTFQRTIQDDAGAVLTDEAGIWMRGARVAADNRLKPNEERIETFKFNVPRRQQARVQARFSYS